MNPPVITHLFISAGHNFFGRYGQPAATHELRSVSEVECVAGYGLRGDRFYGYRPEYKGQITFFALEVLEEMQRALALPAISPGAVRRNAVTRGLDLNACIGREFELQGLRFFGAEECRPCPWMNQAVGPGAEDWLRGRGGLRAKVLTTGVLRCDASPTP